MPATAREARARRRLEIRSRVAAATLSAFVLAWGVIAFDGPMGAQATATASTATASSSSGTASSSSGTAADDGSSSAGLPSVTTAQS
jgi:hypothetical protein